MTDESADSPLNSVPKQQRGLRRGNPGNKGGGDKPQTYKLWLKHLLSSEKHRKEFTAVIEDKDHPKFMIATEHAAAYAEGKPVQKLEADVQAQIVVTQGLGLKRGEA